MPKLFFLPGYAGSELSTEPTGEVDVWVHKVNLGISYFRALKLAPDGVNPAPVGGQKMYVRGSLHDYYFLARYNLQQQLGGDNYQILSHPYDWRLSAFTTGRHLALRIIAEVPANDPCAIVAHSFGGLVTRCAWLELKRQGKEALVRRVITLGTPHQGSYKAVGYLSLEGAVIDDLIFLYSFLPEFDANGEIELRRGVAEVMATWPATYETFPFLDVPDAEGDDDREKLFDASNWPTSPALSQRWLNHAKGVFQAAMRDPLSLPPPWVLTTVAAEGQDTYYRLRDAGKIGKASALEKSDAGDGTVTVTSALVPQSTRKTVDGLHFDLPKMMTDGGDLADLVREVRVPPPPAQLPAQVPPVEELPLKADFHLLEPPLPEGIGRIEKIAGG